MFLAEMLLGVVMPAIFLMVRKIRTSPAGLLATAAIVVSESYSTRIDAFLLVPAAVTLFEGITAVFLDMLSRRTDRHRGGPCLIYL